jgi:hypothetical protein
MYIEAAGERDSAMLIEIDWLERALVREVKATTSLATMVHTSYWVSQGRQSVEDVKQHVMRWLVLRYKLSEFQFYQSKDEYQQSTPLSLYFHVVCRIGVVPRKEPSQ